MQTEVRAIYSQSEQNSARNVFDKTWQLKNGTEITPNLLQAMVHSGAYLSGAFIDENVLAQLLHFQQLPKGFIYIRT